MKIATICWLGLLLTIGSTVSVQRKVIPPPSPSCDGFSNLVEWGSQFRFFSCHWVLTHMRLFLAPPRSETSF